MSSDTRTAELIPTGSVLTDPAACMAEIARMQAVTAVASARADVASDRLRALSGLQPGWKAETDAGDPLVTDPKDAPSVHDRDTWEAWAIKHHGDRCRTVDRIRHARLDSILADRDHPARDLLLEILVELDALEAETVIDDRLLPDLYKRGKVVDVEGDDGETWRQLVTDAGEPVPGVEVRAKSAPQLRATPDRKYLQRLTDEITDRVGMPEIPGGDE